MELGKRDTVGLATPTISNDGSNPFGNGFWASRFDPGALPRVPFEIYRMTLRGPSGSQINLYVDTQFKAGTARATLNEWQGTHPILVLPGQSVIAYWNTSATPAPYLAMYLRTPQ